MSKRVEHGALPPETLELVAQRFRVLGDATRLGLLQALMTGERTVQELASAVNTGQANASKHLALLAEQRLVARRREGLFARYRIADPSVAALCELVCGSLARGFDDARSRLPAPPGAVSRRRQTPAVPERR